MFNQAVGGVSHSLFFFEDYGMQRFRLYTMSMIFFILILFVPRDSYTSDTKTLFSPVSTRLWAWPSMGVRFSLPRTWKIRINSRSRLIAAGPGIALKMARVDGVTDPRLVARQALSGYHNVADPRIIKQKWVPEKKNNLLKYAMFGKGRYALDKPEGRRNSPVQFGVVGIYHRRKRVAFYLRTYWFKSDPEAEAKRRLTYMIVKSVRDLRD